MVGLNNGASVHVESSTYVSIPELSIERSIEIKFGVHHHKSVETSPGT